MSAKPEVATAPPVRRRNWRGIALIAVGALVVLGMIAWAIADKINEHTRNSQIDENRARVATAAVSQLSRDVHGAIVLQEKIDGGAWDKGRIVVALTVGTCQDIPGYVETEQYPTDKSRGVVHVLVGGRDNAAPLADVRVATDSDLFQLKRTLNDTDSGLRHCVVGDVRLLPIDG